RGHPRRGAARRARRRGLPWRPARGGGAERSRGEGGASMLTVTGVEAGYGGSEVLHGISLRVEDGETVVVLGPNGHGKTTLLRVVSGLLRPSAGTVEFDGVDTTYLPTEDIVG